MIDVQHITKRFGSAVAVNNVTFQVYPGEVVGFLGPNGAGKSTTMKCITCYHSPDAGLISVNGFDVFRQPLQVRRQIGYLPESNPLYTEMGVVDYLLFIADVHDVPARERRDRVETIIDKVGLTRMRHKDIGELSKGYRQRVGLAQAMVADPPVLILDEPTTGLDPNQIVEIRALIKQLGKEKCVILSTHILSEVRLTCHRIIIISEGSLVHEGTPEELIEKGKGELRYHVTFVTEDGDAVDRALANHPDIASYTLMEPPGAPEKPAGRPTTPSEAPALAGDEAELAEGEVVEESAAEAAPLVAVEVPTQVGIARYREDQHRYSIVSRGGKELAESLFDLAASRGWRLSELTREETSLEDVFQKLTKREVRYEP